MAKTAVLCLGFVILIGAVAGATTVVPRFGSVGQAVATLPELSILNTQVQKVALAQSLNNPDFVGTVFAPINEGLEPLVSALNGDLTALGSSVNDIFATSVLNTKIPLEQLQNGQQLTASNGNTVTVTITTVNGGKVYYINKARITTANILAGKAIIHEVRPILLPPTYQSLMEQMGFIDTSTAVPTQLYANPTVTTPEPSPSPKPSPSPAPVPSPSPVPVSSPAPEGSGNAGSGSSGNTGSSPSPSPTPASSPAPGSPSGSGSGSNNGGSTDAGAGSNGGSTGTPSTNPGGSDPSTGAGSNPTGTTGTDPTSSTGTFTPTPWVPPTTTTPSVTTESGVKADPDLGLDISAAHSPVLATLLLLLPALVAALL